MPSPVPVGVHADCTVLSQFASENEPDSEIFGQSVDISIRRSAPLSN
jgi:hypothetical protein